MNLFYKFLDELCGLHDAQIDALIFSPNKSSLEIHIDDIYSNFIGMEKYPGEIKGAIYFEGVNDVLIDIGPIDKFTRIYVFSLDEDKLNHARISLSPGGLICFDFLFVKYPEICYPQSPLAR